MPGSMLAAAAGKTETHFFAGPAGAMEVPAERVYDTPPLPEEVVLIHGENDAQAPLAPLPEWARPNGHPVIVVPGADHFFSRSLPLLLKLVRQHLAA
ncbi:hypothetical protein [Bordetella hinzii]|uniref:hypothetical protein n=1 Tax=Bordetella hinzii TaxID=103855 RepID=UPI001F0EE838|nr:hypothetical protein [Bordetella hinzii]